MSGMAVAQALSSDVSWKILDMLVAGDSGESRISRLLGIQPKLVRVHLQKLVQAGLVSMLEETRVSGKVTAAYRLTGIEKSVGFPPRKYEFLSEALLKSLVASLGEESARMVLRDIGVRIGEDAGSAVISSAHPSKWDPGAYAEHFVKRFLAEMKTYPRLVSVGPHRVVYEELNCPFQELAIKFPALVCDVLDEAVHEGIDAKLGVKSTRLSCKGHGDPVCRFCVAWPGRQQKHKILLSAKS